MLHDWKYASKRSEFLGFYCYLCHVCYGFLCLWIRNTKISENSDMAKSWATFCCPGTYKNNYQSCCGIKVIKKTIRPPGPRGNALLTPGGLSTWPFPKDHGRLFLFLPKLNRRHSYVSFEKFCEVRIILES